MPTLDFIHHFIIKYYIVPSSSLICLVMWTSFLISTDFTQIQLLKPYIVAQAIISVSSMIFGSFLECGLTIQLCGYSRYTVSKQELWKRMLELDSVQRIVFLILGSGWFSKTIGIWPFFVLTRAETDTLSTVGHFVRAHLVLSTFIFLLETILLIDSTISLIKRIGMIDFMDMINPAFWILISSFVWGFIWIVVIFTQNEVDKFSVYAMLQLGFTGFYFLCSFGLSHRFSFQMPYTGWNFELEPGFVLLVLLILDFLRRIVFICLGTLWFMIASPVPTNSDAFPHTTPIQFILKHGIGAFTDFDIHIQPFVWHFLFSIIMLCVDLTMFGMIIYYIAADEPVERTPAQSLCTSVFRPPFQQMFKPHNEKSEELCSICHERHDENTFTTHVCGHSFHESCIKPWLERNLSCPLCRSDLLIIVTPYIDDDCN
jgi:hypothetical protein